MALGALLLAGSNLLRLAVQLLLFPILARLLGPADLGMLALAMPVLLLGLVLSEGGMGQTLLRTSVKDTNMEATVLLTALVASSVLATLLYFAAPALAAVMGHADIAPVLRGLSPILLLAGLCCVPSIRVQRGGTGAGFAIADIFSTLFGAAAAILGALAGWGVWSLVAQQLVLWCVRTVTLCSRAGLLSTGRPSWGALAIILRRAAPLIGAALLGLLAISIDVLAVGRILGVTQAGHYALAWQILRMPQMVLVAPVLVPLLPALLRLSQDRAASAALVTATLRMLLGLVLPLTLGMALVADVAVGLLLGPRWAESSLLLTLLFPAAVSQAMTLVGATVLQARARPRTQFAVALLNTSLIALCVAAGASFGLAGIAVGLSLAGLAGATATLTVVMREVGLNRRGLAAALAPTLAAAGAMGCGVLGLRMALPAGLPAWMELAAATSVGVLLYAGTMHLLAPGQLAADLAPLRRGGKR